MDDQDIKNRIVEKLLRKGVIGSHKMTIDGVVNMAFPSHEQGSGKTLIDEMLADPASPIEGYGGGGRQNIRLTSAQDAVDYLNDNDGDIPFGY